MLHCVMQLEHNMQVVSCTGKMLLVQLTAYAFMSLLHHVT